MRLPLSLVLAACLTGCLTGPQDPPRSRTPAERGPGGESAAIAFRVPLPGSAIGRVDSAELRLQREDGSSAAWPMAVSDSALMIPEIPDSEAAPARLQIIAFSRGEPAYYGEGYWEPSRGTGAGIAVSLGPVGQVRVEGAFESRID